MASRLADEQVQLVLHFIGCYEWFLALCSPRCLAQGHLGQACKLWRGCCAFPLSGCGPAACFIVPDGFSLLWALQNLGQHSSASVITVCFPFALCCMFLELSVLCSVTACHLGNSIEPGNSARWSKCSSRMFVVFLLLFSMEKFFCVMLWLLCIACPCGTEMLAYSPPANTHDRDTLPRLFEVLCHCVRVHMLTLFRFWNYFLYSCFCYFIEMLTYCPPYCFYSKFSPYSYMAEVMN